MLTTETDAKVHKRPLLRPAIPSPYAGASQQKVVYVSARTPFLSTVKRVEKLLKLSDKRLVQAATTNARLSSNKMKRGRDDPDEVLGIAKEVERLKSKRRKGGTVDDDVEGAGEEVVIKASGKAIQKAMELGLWFQQREEYLVRLRTGSVGAVDDIELNEEEGVEDQGHDRQEGGVVDRGNVTGEVDTSMGATVVEQEGSVEQDQSANDGGSAVSKSSALNQMTTAADGATGDTTDPALSKQEPIPETRIRYVSVLEVAVSLR
ncbi:hypothetical protein LTR78_005753 [Recurvomyces mirabilis]|uniref:Uncharacterized protein n=2 Tax=Recurvomyces mirabilis TaxID=574656 RepID=A0AAE0WM62_9PEZI|nr:hypothetical protein LTR78_005753 [Recurvomyces mirabilis]